MESPAGGIKKLRKPKIICHKKAIGLGDGQAKQRTKIRDDFRAKFHCIFLHARFLFSQSRALLYNIS